MDYLKMVDEVECKLEFQSDEEEKQEDEHFESFFKKLRRFAANIGSDEAKVITRCKEELKSSWDSIM